MLFNSYTFIVFFGVVLLLHSLPFSWRLRKFNLLIASYLFYAAWSPPFVILIWISTLIDWLAGLALHRTENPAKRRFFLGISLAANLGLLGFFKYGIFLTENFSHFLRFIGIHYQPALSEIVLPVGISFYTFQTLSYTFDIYKRKAAPWQSFLDYALYVTFFPQLVAGPIVRSVDFLPQCLEPRRASRRQMTWGLSLVVLGLFEKVVVADGLLAPISEKIYSAPRAFGFADAWSGTLAFSGQIFCDFAGYSTCAIGAALCLGFAIQDNFRFPYAAIGFSDFWTRWHVSLSSWLRDYLYISLGGNRKGAVRTYVNLMLTMLLGGLWHGAAWTFVVWGGLHGLYLIGERGLKTLLGGHTVWTVWPMRVALALLTYLLVCITWVFFRARSFSGAFAILRGMAGAGDPSDGPVLKPTEVLMVSGLTLLMLGIHWCLRNSSVEEIASKMPWWLRATVLAACLFAIATMTGDSRAFIYFQF